MPGIGDRATVSPDPEGGDAAAAQRRRARGAHDRTADERASSSELVTVDDSTARSAGVARAPACSTGLATFTDEAVAFIRDNSASVCLALTLSGIATFSILFGSLAVVNHRNYGTWAYDGAIYDQAIWLVSRGEQTFMSVRGMDVWGHHLNLVFFLFAPAYWLGAGPEFLYVVQNFVIALAALPIYLDCQGAFPAPDHRAAVRGRRT